MWERSWLPGDRSWLRAMIAVALLIPPISALGQVRDRVREVEFDREDPPTLTHPLGDHWSFGGALELDAIGEKNFDLDSGDPDNTATLEPRVDVGVAYAPQDDLRFYTQVELSRGIFLQREGSRRNAETKARLRQAYVTMTGLSPGLSLRLGRQRFEDKRDWWYDEDLDAARLLFQTGRLGLELSASRNEVVGGDLLNRERADRSTNYFAVGRYAYDDDAELNAYVLVQDRSERREKPVFFGARSIGTIGSRFEHWIDAAIVRGTDDGRDIRAYGFDIGADYRLELPQRPSLLFGVAFGSGDANPDDGTNSDFRQTGLQGSYFYYGEVLAPELSNMWIYTAGVKLHPARRTSVRILYHLYRQHRAADQLRDVLIDTDPDGRSRDLGQALDILATHEGSNDVYLDFIVGMFSPGAAFGREGDRAYFAQFLVTYEFW